MLDYTNQSNFMENIMTTLSKTVENKKSKIGIKTILPHRKNPKSVAYYEEQKKFN